MLKPKSTGKDSVRWRPVRRQGSHDTREDAQNQFYEIPDVAKWMPIFKVED